MGNIFRKVLKLPPQAILNFFNLFFSPPIALPSEKYFKHRHEETNIYCKLIIVSISKSCERIIELPKIYPSWFLRIFSYNYKHAIIGVVGRIISNSLPLVSS